MKKVISLLIAMMVLGQTALAQMVPQDDPIGTVYSYETEGPGAKVPTTVTLVNKSDSSFTVKLSQSIPQVGVVSFETMYNVDHNSMYLSLDEMKKTVSAPMEKMGVTLDKLEYTGSPTVTPLVGKVGDVLPNTKTVMTMAMMGMTNTTYSTIVSNKIIKEEQITLPAGTFDTFVVETIADIVVEAMGSTQTQRITTLNWILPGRGPVQTIQKDDKGNQTTVKLIEIKRP